jgi:RNA polymerase sigma-70 factor (ECF subfamily)
LNQAPDNDIMLEVRAGQLDKLGILFDRHSKSLFSFFYRMTGDKEISQDLVQNVFFRMLKYRHTFTAEGKFITWMYHLARNVSSDYFKKSKKFSFSKNLDLWANRLSDPTTREEDFGKEQEIALLQQAMESLPADKREVLVLSRYQELKYQEIAKVLNCTEGNVKVKVHRAFQELRSIFMKLTQEKKYETGGKN